jgi:tetratricopeptide (TPR) repeat protein
MILGATGVLAIALLGFLLFQNRTPGPRDLLPDPVSQNVNVQTANTATVTNIAIEKLTQGNIPAGQKAVEALLDRGALPQAKAALDAVPKSKGDDPAVFFLKGRLAWQSIQTDSKDASTQDFSLQDARRNWEWAHKEQPQSVPYLNALGFAYYAEGKFERANNAWFEALVLIGKASATANTKECLARKDALTSYAGLALGLQQSAQKQPAEKQAKLLKASLQYRQCVMTQDAVNFEPNALSKNWLWSQKLIKDWRSLLAKSY